MGKRVEGPIPLSVPIELDGHLVVLVVVSGGVTAHSVAGDHLADGEWDDVTVVIRSPYGMSFSFCSHLGYDPDGVEKQGFHILELRRTWHETDNLFPPPTNYGPALSRM